VFFVDVKLNSIYVPTQRQLIVFQNQKVSVYNAVRTGSLNKFQVILRLYRVREKCYFVLINHRIYCKRDETKFALIVKALLCHTLHQLVIIHFNIHWINGMSNSFPSSTFCQIISLDFFTRR
jgi:hypothetical protein